MSLTIKDTALQSIVDEQEFSDFTGVVQEVCKNNPDIQGVVITGSIVQRMRLPDPDCTPPINDYEQAYSLIENKGRRRTFPNKGSDLDVWVCLRDPENIGDVKKILEQRAIDLLCWLSQNQHLHQTPEWIEMKTRAFNDFYKQIYMYSNHWNMLNPQQPWMADSFKGQLVQTLKHNMPGLVQRIDYNFSSPVHEDFFEIRAFPESTFNLRVEELLMDGQKNKTPFPFILEKLLDMQRNCFVLYASDEGQEKMIYPFNPEGQRLGEGIKSFIYES